MVTGAEGEGCGCKPENAKDGRQPPEAGTEVQNSLLALGASVALDFRPLNHERVHFCCFKPPWSWYLLTAATETNILLSPKLGLRKLACSP